MEVVAELVDLVILVVLGFVIGIFFGFSSRQ